MLIRVTRLKTVLTQISTTKFLSTSPYLGNKKAALVLSGSGVYDGTEIHEASACLIHLSRHDADVSIFAPDVKQFHVIDHTKGIVTLTFCEQTFNH